MTRAPARPKPSPEVADALGHRVPFGPHQGATLQELIDGHPEHVVELLATRIKSPYLRGALDVLRGVEWMRLRSEG